MKQRMIAVVCALAVVTSCGAGNPMIRVRSLAAGPSADLQPETIPAANSSGPLQVIGDDTASGGAYLGLDAVTPSSARTAGSFYVDSVGGNDNLDGRSPETPWKSLARAGAADLAPGESLLFKRGGSWTGSITVPWSGVTVGAYGSGPLPLITNDSTGGSIVDVRGSNDIIAALELRATSTAHGYLSGFNFSSDAKFNVLAFTKTSGLYAGVYLNRGADNNQIVGNTIGPNRMINVNANDDSGAFGVLIWGDNNEIANNDLHGNVGLSDRYGEDGAAVEIYNGSRNWIHHNRANDNLAFSELGVDPRHTVTGNVYAYNLITSNLDQASFVITRGPTRADGTPQPNGPVDDTRIYGNTAYLTAESSKGMVCYAHCSPAILTLENNILVAGHNALESDGSFTEGNNIYWRVGGNPTTTWTIAATSKLTDPLFVDAGRDFHLAANSPAINAGTLDSLSSGFSYDRENKKVPIGPRPDIGSYEVGSTMCANRPNPANGLAIGEVSLPATGKHFIWSRVRPADSAGRAYLLQIDGHCAIEVGGTGLTSDAWTWVNWRDGRLDVPVAIDKLTAGQHTVRIFGADPNVGLDRLLLTTDGNCRPQAADDTCA